VLFYSLLFDDSYLLVVTAGQIAILSNHCRYALALPRNLSLLVLKHWLDSHIVSLSCSHCKKGRSWRKLDAFWFILVYFRRFVRLCQ